MGNAKRARRARHDPTDHGDPTEAIVARGCTTGRVHPRSRWAQEEVRALDPSEGLFAGEVEPREEPSSLDTVPSSQNGAHRTQGAF
jgi:hypothetical protein